jgi:hypothetical protein
VPGIGVLTITAEFIQYCRDETQTNMWERVNVPPGKVYDKHWADCPEISPTAADGTPCSISVPHDGDAKDFVELEVRQPWRVTAKIDYLEFDDPVPPNKMKWTVSFGDIGSNASDIGGYYNWHKSEVLRELGEETASRAEEWNIPASKTREGMCDGDGEYNSFDCDGVSNDSYSRERTCITVQDQYLIQRPYLGALGTSRNRFEGYSSTPTTEYWDLTPAVRVSSTADSVAIVGGGVWDMTVADTSPVEFCNTTFKSTFDGYLSNLSVASSSNPRGCDQGPIHGSVIAYAPKTSGTYQGYYPYEKWGDAHLYPATSYVADPFYSLYSGLWEKYAHTMTGSGIRLVTCTNFGFIDQIYDVEITIAGGS